MDRRSEEISHFECPVCGLDQFKTLEILLKHIQAHNNKDPEINLSVVAERDEFLNGMF